MPKQEYLRMSYAQLQDSLEDMEQRYASLEVLLEMSKSEMRELVRKNNETQEALHHAEYMAEITQKKLFSAYVVMICGVGIAACLILSKLLGG